MTNRIISRGSVSSFMPSFGQSGPLELEMDWGVLWRVSDGGAVWHEWVEEGRKGRVSAILILVWYWYATSIWIRFPTPTALARPIPVPDYSLSLVLLVAFGFIHLRPFRSFPPILSRPLLPPYPWCLLYLRKSRPPKIRAPFPPFVLKESPHTSSIVNRVFGFGDSGGEKGPEPWALILRFLSEVKRGVDPWSGLISRCR